MTTTQLAPQRTGSVTVKPLRQVANVRELLVNDQAKQQLAAVAAGHMKPERMMRLMANSLRTTPQLAECEPLSLLGAMMTCASLGVEPNTPLQHAYLIPFKNSRKNVTEVQLIIGYRGMIDLARRSGHIVNIHGDVVYDGDDFSFEYGSNQHLTHRPRGKRVDPIYAYCHAKLTDGEAFVVLPWDEVMAIRDASQGYKTAVKYGKKDSPWIAHQHEMASKTAVRALFKYLPISIEMDGGKLSDALAADETRIDFAAFAARPEDGPMIESEIVDEETGEVLNEDHPAAIEDRRVTQQTINQSQKAEAEAEPNPPSRRRTAPKPSEKKATDPSPDADGPLPLAQASATDADIQILIDRVRGWAAADIEDGSSAAATIEAYSDQIGNVAKVDQGLAEALIAEIEAMDA